MILPRALNFPEPRTYLLNNVTVPAASAPAIFQLDAIPIGTAGTMVQVCAWVGAVDSAVAADASNTILEQAFRVVLGGLGPLPVNRIDKQTIGGAGTFAQDVNFLIVGGAPVNGVAPLNLHAQNVAVAARTGDICLHYWLNRGAF